ncbi:hypothetical protein HHI36_024256 [Cryptolaemus montrouzieri]|uniref:U-box domain-containing protein n=1 Tax=Cryptolaemus montrouzieri TaxID=559131 RepID=A0ABD2NJC6_9CUCU
MATSGSVNEIKIWSIISSSVPKQKESVQKVAINLVAVLDGHSSSVTCVKYNSEGSLLISCSLDKTIKMWDNSGNCISQLYGHTRYVNCVTISKDSTLIASGSNDRQIIIWDLNGNLSIDSELFKQGEISYSTEYTCPEIHVSQNVEHMEILEKLDDVVDGSINSCSFYGNTLLGIGSGDKSVKLFSLDDTNSIAELSQSPLEGHTYAVNYLDISRDGLKLATCSQDGCTFLWNPTNGQKIGSVPTSTLSVRVCRFSADGKMLIVAGDEEKATIWDTESMENIATLEGHLDAITCACFTPDCTLAVTTCFNEDFRLWNCRENFKTIHIEEDVHTTGIQSCDFSPNLEPIPNISMINQQTYLLATCGNDSVAKLWCLTVPKIEEELYFDQINVKIWRTLYGHGGSLTCIKFSPCLGEIVSSTATDRQARLWSVYSGECLYVLDHDSIVTTCSFTENCSVLAIGCIDKSLWLWKLPSQLVFQTAVVNKIKYLSKNLMDWSILDVTNWMETIGLGDLKPNALNVNLDGQKIFTSSEAEICSALDINEEKTLQFSRQMKWLKQDNMKILNTKRDDIPFDFLCPITHEIMLEPVICSDGFTYERRAITEWFMAGKYTSPMTNAPLATTAYKLNNDLRNAIHTFLDIEA